MRKEKTKNDLFWQMGTLPFVALWAGSYAASWLGLLALLWAIRQPLFFVPDRLITPIAVIFISLLPALIQVQLVERLLKHRMRRWALYSLAGTLLTVFTFTDGSPNDSRFFMSMMSLFLPMALLQMGWLWRRVNAAWLWPLASVTASLVFAIPLRGNASTTVLFALAGLLYGLVQGGVMRYLWLQPKETEKTKVEAAQANEMIENRATRLQQAQADNLPDIIGETTRIQYDTRQS